MWPCIVTNFYIIKPTRCTNFPNLLRHETLHVSDSSSVHHQEFFTVHSAMVYIIQVFKQLSGRTIWLCSKAIYKPAWYIPVPSVQWINTWCWAEELSETCRVSCRSKFGKLVHLVGFIIKEHPVVFNKMVFIPSKHNNTIQSSAPQYGYMFRSFLDHLQANIFQ